MRIDDTFGRSWMTLLGVWRSTESSPRKGQEDLSILRIDALPSEEAGINGPRTGSNHCQGGGKSCGEDTSPDVIGQCEYLPEFKQRDYCSGDRRPQSGEEKNSHANQQHGRYCKQRGRVAS